MKKIKSGIYLIKNIINGKIYIGSAVDIERRFYFHKWSLNKNSHSNEYLQKAWNKHGEEYFEFEVYMYCKRVDLIFYEQLTLDAFTARVGRKKLYNICLIASSTLGKPCKEETKAKLRITSRKIFLGKKHPEEIKEKIRLGNIGKNKGKKHTDEARAKMSESRKGKKFSEEHKKKLGEAQKGRKMSETTKEKLRLANFGRKLSDEDKERIRANGKTWKGSKKGRKLSVETREKMSIAKRGKKLSEYQKERLQIGLQKYWEERRSNV